MGHQGRTNRPVFVGRGPELEYLRAEAERARASEPRVVVIEGEAGLGKSALLVKFLEEAEDFLSFRASGVETEAELDFGVIEQLVAGVSAQAVRSLPHLEGGPHPGLSPLAVGRDLVMLLGALQQDGPVALVLDDLHWADSSSLRALSFLIRRLQFDKVLVLATTRPPPEQLDESWARLLLDSERCSRVHLRGLNDEDVAALLRASGAEGSTERGLAERLRAHTAGNPLYLRMIMEELRPDRPAGGRDRLPIPRSLASTVLARVVRLPAETRGLLAAIAVVGGRVPLILAAALADLEDAASALEPALEAGLVEWEPAEPSRPVRFIHPLLQQAIYDDIAPSRRGMLHLRAAEMIGGRSSLDHRVAAAHRPDEKLATELEAAAVADERREALALAAAHLLQSADVSEEPAERERRTIRAMVLLLFAGEVRRALGLEARVEAYSPSPARDAALGFLALLTGRVADAERRAIETLRSAEEAGATRFVSRSLLLLSAIHTLTGSPSAVVAEAGRALEIGVEDRVRERHARAQLAVAHALLGSHEGALSALGPLAADPGSVAGDDLHLLTVRGILRVWADDPEGSAEDLGVVVRRALEAQHAEFFLAHAMCFLAEAQLALGEWDDAVRHVDLAVSLAEAEGRLDTYPTIHGLAALVHVQRGDEVRAKQEADVARHWCSVFAGRGPRVYASLGQAAVGRAIGDHSVVADALEPLVATASAEEAGGFRLPELLARLAEARLGQGRLEEAGTLIERAGAWGPSLSQAIRLDLARLRGDLAARRGELDVAAAAFEEEPKLNGGKRPFELGLLDLAQGSFLRRTGRRRAAIEALRRAHDALAALGARPYAARAAAELAACGLQLGAAGQSQLLGLTERELDVARLVARGLTDREVGAELYLSPHTVNYHLRGVYAKLGLRSRRELRHRLAGSH